MRRECEDLVQILIQDHPEGRTRLKPLVDEFRLLERKGFDKMAEDVWRIQQIRSEMADLVDRMLDDVEAFYGMEDLETEKRRAAEKREALTHLTNIQTDGEHFAACDARMFTSPWSRSFVHGSDSMLAIGDVAAKILRPGERIARVAKVSWKKPVTQNLRFTVYDHQLMIGQKRCQDAHLDGELITDQGRHLHFFAEEIPGSPIRVHLPETNVVANFSLDHSPRYCHQRYGEVVYNLRRPSSEVCAAMDMDQAGQMATLVEMITWAAVKANDTIAVDLQPLRLMGRISGLVLPDRYEDLFNGPGTLKLAIQSDMSVRGNSGMELTPFEYEFSYMEKPGKGMLASTESAACASRHLDASTGGRVY